MDTSGGTASFAGFRLEPVDFVDDFHGESYMVVFEACDTVWVMDEHTGVDDEGFLSFLHNLLSFLFFRGNPDG